jgi:hypothetical protein
MNFGPWAENLSELERVARCRSLRALAMVFVGPTDPIVHELAMAETDSEALDRARVHLDAMGALSRRRILATYGAMAAPARRWRR